MMVRTLQPGGEPAEPLTLDPDARARLDDALDDLDRHRAAAVVTADRCVVL